MNALMINCSPVRTGATAEIVHIVSEHLKGKYDVKNICIDDFKVAFCSVECKEAVAKRTDEIKAFCDMILEA